jgi:hypothetical protein
MEIIKEFTFRQNNKQKKQEFIFVASTKIKESHKKT